MNCSSSKTPPLRRQIGVCQPRRKISELNLRPNRLSWTVLGGMSLASSLPTFAEATGATRRQFDALCPGQHIRSLCVGGQFIARLRPGWPPPAQKSFALIRSGHISLASASNVISSLAALPVATRHFSLLCRSEQTSRECVEPNKTAGFPSQRPSSLPRHSLSAWPRGQRRRGWICGLPGQMRPGSSCASLIP